VTFSVWHDGLDRSRPRGHRGADAENHCWLKSLGTQSLKNEAVTREILYLHEGLDGALLNYAKRQTKILGGEPTVQKAPINEKPLARPTAGQAVSLF
jgi:hypothetical protein